MNSLSQFKSLAVAFALVGSVIAAQAQTQVIYDNSGDPVLGTYAPTDNSLEFGDQIILDGDSRIVTEFRLEYFSSDAAGDATVRFRSNSGPSLEPDDILFETDPIPLEANFNTLEITGIGVPISGDTFTFTIEFDVAGTQNVGLILRNPPSIGSSFDDVWVQADTGDWATRNIPAATANLAAQIGAVPEPSTVALSIVGALALCGIARRRK
tara:strand:+ start:146 stop:778 length:633 start_codon:yes stop_codon:yes gene_type:complete